MISAACLVHSALLLSLTVPESAGDAIQTTEIQIGEDASSKVSNNTGYNLNAGNESN